MITNILTNAFTVQQAWCRETSSDPDNWTPENPAWGQCAVTALIVQDVLGGKLIRGLVDGKSHYWNLIQTPAYVIADGGLAPVSESIVDITCCQFASTAKWGMEPPEERTREYVLSFPATKRRYEMLKERMVKIVYIPEPDDDKTDGGVL